LRPHLTDPRPSLLLGLATVLVVAVVAWSSDGVSVPDSFTASAHPEACPVHIVDVRAMTDVRNDVFVLDEELHELRQVTDDGEAADATISPDGSRVAVSSGLGTSPVGRASGIPEYRIYLYPADGAGPGVAVTDGPYHTNPDWSPGGTRVVYANGDIRMGGSDRIETVDVVDGTTTVVYTADDDADIRWPQWSPDGRRIAFMHRDGDGSRGIWTVDADGGSPTNLGVQGFVLAYDWSPDGSHLAVDKLLPDPAFPSEYDAAKEDGLGAGIRDVDLESGRTTVFAGTAGTQLTVWTPAGLFVSERPKEPGDGTGELHLIDPGDGTRRTIGEYQAKLPSTTDATAAC
jgi:Tol biopolymer transport system component